MATSQHNHGAPHLTRRTFVKSVGAGVALGVLPGLLVTTGNAAPAASVTRFADATPGTLVVGLVAEPTSLDPGQLTDINSMKLLGAIYDTLVRFKPNSFDLAPGLATSWDMSGDGLLYTFKLRQGVKFHDGTDFNADAVKFTYDRLLDPNSPYADTGPFPFAPGYYGSIAETIVVDPATVQFRLKHPDSALVNAFTLNTGRIVSPQAVKTARANFAQNPVGTGPFKFVSWDHNVRIALAANPNYWDGAPPSRSSSSDPWPTSRRGSPNSSQAASTSSSTCRPTTSSRSRPRHPRCSPPSRDRTCGGSRSIPRSRPLTTCSSVRP